MGSAVSEWTRCRPWIESALASAGNTHTIADVERLIGEQRAILLAGKNSALVVEIITYPAVRVCRIWLGGGDLKELREWAPSVIEMARAYGCTKLRIEGRDGWVRALKTRADRSYTVVEKDI